MKIMKFTSFFGMYVAFSLAFLVQSCTKEPIAPTQHEVYHISDNFKSYTAFGKGSYWVYQRLSPLPSVLDTIRVDGTIFENRIHTIGNSQYYYDAIELALSSKVIGLKKGEITAGPSTTTGLKSETYRIYFTDGSYLSVLIPHYPIDSLVHLGQVEGDYINRAFYTQLEVNQALYSDVYETRITIDPTSEQSTEHNYLFAKNYGCVKFSSQVAGQNTKEEWVLKSSALLPLE